VSIGAAGSAAVCALGACTGYGADVKSDPVFDAAPDAVDDSRGPSSDAPADGDVTAGSACPSPAPRCDPAACTQSPIFAPSSTEYPFGITTAGDSIYWVAQHDVDGAALAYDGGGMGVLRRMKRDGTQVEVLSANEKGARALAVDQGFLYWAVGLSGGPVELHRTRADCAPPACSIESISLSTAVIIQIVTAAPGIVFLLSANGDVVRATASPFAAEKVHFTADFGTLAVDARYLYAVAPAYAGIARIEIATGALQPKWVTAPPADAAAPGFRNVTANCRALYALGGSPERLVHIDTTTGVISPTGIDMDGFALLADDRYVWSATPNAGGIHAYEPFITKNPISIYSGNVFAFAQDDIGIYWGEHGANNTGAIYVLSK